MTAAKSTVGSADLDPEVAGLAHLAEHVGGAQHGLRRDARVVQAASADACRARRRRSSCRAARRGSRRRSRPVRSRSRCSRRCVWPSQRNLYDARRCGMLGRWTASRRSSCAAACAIPLEEIELRTSRSSGPGGQHANVTASRVEAVFDVRRLAGAARGRARARLLERLGPRVSAVAQDARSQLRNRELALERLRAKLDDGAARAPPAPADRARPPARASGAWPASAPTRRARPRAGRLSPTRTDAAGAGEPPHHAHELPEQPAGAADHGDAHARARATLAASTRNSAKNEHDQRRAAPRTRARRGSARAHMPPASSAIRPREREHARRPGACRRSSRRRRRRSRCRARGPPATATAASSARGRSPGRERRERRARVAASRAALRLGRARRGGSPAAARPATLGVACGAPCRAVCQHGGMPA